MSNSDFGKTFFAFVGGAAIGAALGVLFAPAKGTVTRRRIATTSRDMKNTVVDKIEDLVESAEEMVEEFKETAADFLNHTDEELKKSKR